MIQRTIYVDELISFKDKHLIKVITGIRRCGKSTLFELFQAYLKNNGVSSKQIIGLNFEDMAHENLLNYIALYDYVNERLVPDKMNYIFLDEIQQVENFEKAIDSLFIKKNCDVYVTGSNAKLLSGELASLLSGRYIEIKMLPLSFKEYMGATENNYELSKKYNLYLENSSFPYTLALKRKKDIRMYLDGVYNSVVLKDVVERRRIGDVSMLQSIIRFIFHNIGNLSSPKKISDTMTSAGRKISVHTVENYLSALCDSFIAYKIGRYDIKGKQYLKSGEKYYVVDIGLRFYLLGNKNTDIDHILENVVFLELLRRGYEIYIGKVGEEEVDFIAINEDGTEYYQVASSVLDPETLNRELRPLLKIEDHYPK